MSIVICGNQITPYNSTTYVDLLGILVGLDRLPGETAAAFMDRIRLAAKMDRGSDYIGQMNEIALELGLQMQKALHISDDTGSFVMDSSIAGVHLKNAELETTIPILSLTSDNFWQWATLSSVVAQISATGHFTATLVSADGPALTVVKQSAEGL
jgi:hypothetical protein